MKISLWIAGAATVLMAGAVGAQPYPNKAVRVIVPFAAGGATDIVTRVVGQKLSELWGQQVDVDNRGGAGGNIGGELAAKAAPDGYTLFMTSGSIVTANPHIYRKMPFDAAKDLVAVTNVARIAALIVLGVAMLRSPGLDLLAVVGLRQPRETTPSSTGLSRTGEDAKKSDVPAVVDWRAELMPRGMETRIGEAVDYLVNKERGCPIAGIVLMSDSVASRTDMPYETAASAAQDAGIPVFAVGLGSDKRPLNVRVVDLEAPQRVYPGDKFTLTGLLQGFGVENRSVKAELLASKGAADATAPDSRTGSFDPSTIQSCADSKVNCDVHRHALVRHSVRVGFRVRCSAR